MVLHLRNLPYTTLTDWFYTTEMESVYYAVRTQSLYKADTFRLYRFNCVFTNVCFPYTKDNFSNAYYVRHTKYIFTTFSFHIRQEAVTCVCCNELQGSIKCGEFLE